MSGKKVVSLVKPLAEEVVANLGFTLVDVEYKKTIHGMVLELFIDSENGIFITDCEAVSRALDEPLEKLNPTGDVAYTFNVSSLGLDRAFTTDYEYNKYTNKLVVLKFYKQLKPHNVKQIKATLIAHTNDDVTVDFEGEQITIIKNDIAQIVPHIEF